MQSHLDLDAARTARDPGCSAPTGDASRRRRSGPCPAPNFYILGAAKCGTTSLHFWLDQHPDICMSHPKEPFFYEAEYGRGLDHYRRKYFAGYRGERIVGESRHRNLYLPFVARRIANVSPDAKLLVCLRNPTERALSHWWHWYSKAKEPLAFASAIAADLERIRQGLAIDDVCAIEQYAATLDADGKGMYRTYVDSGYYARQLSRYFQYFSEQQLKIAPFESLVGNPQSVVREVLEFLGVGSLFADACSFTAHNEGADGMAEHLDESTAGLLVEHYRSHNDALAQMLGVPFDHWDRPSCPR